VKFALPVLGAAGAVRSDLSWHPVKRITDRAKTEIMLKNFFIDSVPLIKIYS